MNTTLPSPHPWFRADLHCTGLLAVLLIGLTGSRTSVYGDQEGEFEFNREPSGAVLTRYVGPGGNVVTPEKLGGLPVIGVVSPGFSGTVTIRSLTLPRTLIEIGFGSFSYCVGLEEVNIPSNVRTIGTQAFFNCTALTHITISDSVTNIDYAAFIGCTNLGSASIGNGVTMLGAIFEGCSGLTNVSFGSGMSDLWLHRFDDCPSLTTLTIAASNPYYTSLNGGLLNKDKTFFYGCVRGLQGTYKIPESVTTLREEAFWTCQISEVILPPELTEIRANTFFFCTNLTKVTLPDRITSIGERAFLNCSGLGVLDAGSHLKHIGDSAFSDCGSLTNLNLGKALISVGNRAFDACKELRNVALNEGLVDLGDGAFASCASLNSLFLPSSLRYVANSAFYHCTSLTNLPFGRSVITIGRSAFEGCLGLTAASIPDGVVNIRDQAFYGCSNLTVAEFPDSIASVGFRVLSLCPSLTSVRIGKGLSVIEANMFNTSPNLEAIDVAPLNGWLSSVDGVVLTKDKSTMIFCPQGKPGVIRIPETVIRFPFLPFYNCHRLAAVVVAAGVRQLEMSFGGCTNMTGLYFEGDALAPSLYALQPPLLTVFYRPGTSGWGPTFRERPTAPWIALPDYSAWVGSSGLSTTYPAATGQADDPDGDGFSNHDEYLAGTDPVQRASVLALELSPRLSDLSDSDKDPLPANRRALYFASIPGRVYGVEISPKSQGPFELDAVTIATHLQTRISVQQDTESVFYRIVTLP